MVLFENFIIYSCNAHIINTIIASISQPIPLELIGFICWLDRKNITIRANMITLNNSIKIKLSHFM
jgi:hypothetical protein